LLSPSSNPVFCKRFDICKRFGLSGEGRVWSTVSLADFPAFSCLAGGKEILAIAVIDAMSGSPWYLLQTWLEMN
jgi:hypothetical protein